VKNPYILPYFRFDKKGYYNGIKALRIIVVHAIDE